MRSFALLHDPAAMALLISEYRKGRMATAAAESQLSINAFSTLDLMVDGTVSRFDRPEQDSAGAASLIAGYLEGIYCHSGMFNERACVSWERRKP